MKNDLFISRLIPGEKSDVFIHFTTPRLLEQWCYPDGMSLKVPYFEAKAGGRYRYEHTAKDGVYVCTGRFKEFVRGSKLVQIDTVKKPDGSTILRDAESMLTFSESPGGTLVTVTQKDFPDKDSLKECEIGWDQCFNKLESLFESEALEGRAS